MDLVGIKYLNLFVLNRGMRGLKTSVSYVKGNKGVNVRLDSFVFEPGEIIKRKLKGKELSIFLEGLKKVDLSNMFESDIRAIVKAFSTIYKFIGERESKVFLKELWDFIGVLRKVERGKPTRVSKLLDEFVKEVQRNLTELGIKERSNLSSVKEELEKVSKFVTDYPGHLEKFGIKLKDVLKIQSALNEIKSKLPSQN